MKLLIVGNGFDIAHNLKTKYSNFLETPFASQLSKLECEDFWSDFENSLALKVEKMIQNMYGIEYFDMVSDMQAFFEHDEYGLLEEFVDENYLSQEYRDQLRDSEYGIIFSYIDLFQECFSNYLKSIDYSKIERKFDLECYHRIISFNYTPTIEIVYGCEVFHIHGDLNGEIIFGTSSYVNKRIEDNQVITPKEYLKTAKGRPKDILLELEQIRRDGEYGWLVGKQEQVYRLIQDSVEDDLKKIDKGNCSYRQQFIETIETYLTNIETIDFFGFSFGEMDKDITDFLLSGVIKSGINVNVYYFGEEENIKLSNIFKERGYSATLLDARRFCK